VSTTAPAAPPAQHTRSPRRLAGYAFALTAGVLWGTTGPLSTALYAEGAEITAVGFWRVLLAVGGLVAYGLWRRGLFRIDARGLLLIGGLGGALVALFEVAFQFAIAGVGVAPAVALLYTAPVLVALLAWPLLGERVTAPRLLLALLVMVGVALTVSGGPDARATQEATGAARWSGIVGGMMAAASFAGTTLLARWAVPRYGSARMLFWELVGGSVLLAALLPATGHPIALPASAAAWAYIAALGVGAVVLANLAFFAGVKRIEAAPTAVAASIEPAVGALLALLLFGQGLTASGWLGLALVVGGVAAGYRLEAPAYGTAHAG
jgi:drug/metabolite transporter, DME family